MWYWYRYQCIFISSYVWLMSLPANYFISYFFSVVDLVAANFLTNSGEIWWYHYMALQWRHNEPDGVSNHQPRDCLLKRLFRCRSKKKSKLRVTGLCAGNSPVTGEFPTQRASNAENISIWWPYHEKIYVLLALDEGNTPHVGGFPPKGPAKHTFDVLFVASWNKLLDKKQSKCLCFDTS